MQLYCVSCATFLHLHCSLPFFMYKTHLPVTKIQENDLTKRNCTIAFGNAIGRILYTIPKNTIPNRHQSRMDTNPNGHHPEWTPSRMNTIPNEHHPEWTRSRMDTITNGHDPEWTRSRMDTIPNGHDPEWAPSRMDTIPSDHLLLYSYFGALQLLLGKISFTKTRI